MFWCDIGVNLTDKRLDPQSVLQRSLEAKVTQLIITGTNLETSLQALDLSQQLAKNLTCTAGVHPHHASEFTPEVGKQLIELANNKQVVAIGECGLDFNRNFSTPAEQLSAFEQQLEIAAECQLPVFLHERDAFEHQINLLKKYRSQLVGGVAHCFTGNQQQIEAYLELDLYIGITGWFCDPRRGQDLSQAIQSLPLHRVLLETDAPYLRPKGLANNRKVDKGNNEPAYLPYIAEQLSALMDADLMQLNQACNQNTFDLFGISVTKDCGHE